MSASNLLTLAIDIGGTNIKMMVLNNNARPTSDHFVKPTPQPANPAMVIESIFLMASIIGPFDRVSVGFPGVVKKGKVYTAHNLDPSWIGYDIASKIADVTRAPTLAANDADILGYGHISGTGLEMLITLGTGFGSALFMNGTLAPNLELGHHPFRADLSYEQLLGGYALDIHGQEKWLQNLQQAIRQIQSIFNLDSLYLGGGNSRLIDKNALPSNVYISNDIAGLFGGVKLWHSMTSQLSHAAL